ncbi:hypothetical protein Pmani_039404 [Petrolisthes manimaculis]|uniref:Uncharacterized protein n=1 Tax=Petrolisthes manimaculis TaxID=1843537 RepID=A0AAE1NCW7_9EUCA|nr:hypothetical protein Pmani_039404 [Petrolisthes manimaculis]
MNDKKKDEWGYTWVNMNEALDEKNAEKQQEQRTMIKEMIQKDRGTDSTLSSLHPHDPPSTLTTLPPLKHCDLPPLPLPHQYPPLSLSPSTATPLPSTLPATLPSFPPLPHHYPTLSLPLCPPSLPSTATITPFVQMPLPQYLSSLYYNFHTAIPSLHFHCYNTIFPSLPLPLTTTHYTTFPA